jgi:hypothetical protein
MSRFLHFLALLFCVFLQSHLAFATIERTIGPECGNELVVHQGRSDQIVEVFAQGVDVRAQSVSVSGVSASIVKRHSGAENVKRGYGDIGSAEIQFNVNISAAAGNRTVILRYKEPAGLAIEDRFTVRVIARAAITDITLPPLSSPFHTVDIVLKGSGLNFSDGVTLSSSGLTFAEASAIVKRDQPLRDAGGQEIPGSRIVLVSAFVDLQTNSSNKATVRLDFKSQGAPIALTQATIELTLKSSNDCSALAAFGSAGLKRTFVISTPAEPNFVQDTIFDRINRTYNVGDVVNITIRLNRPAVGTKNNPGNPGLITRDSINNEKVFWTLLPSSAFEQTDAVAAPHDGNANLNTITFFAGEQKATITFKFKSCPGPGRSHAVKLVTWKPNASDNTVPNRKEFPFTVTCQ